MTNDGMKKNADRFLGFADTYNDVRPAMPDEPMKIITRYLGHSPRHVVDLGCGTGLSTKIWIPLCERVIGVEPNKDMLELARNIQSANTSFICAYGHKTGIDPQWADVVMCSQSFHWMEPEATLYEVNRILQYGGIFATVDCDWPPISIWQADKAYQALDDKARQMEKEDAELKETFILYHKDKHLENIKKSGFFRYIREIVFSGREQCTAERYIKLLLSQGSIQGILKKYPERIDKDIKEFKDLIESLFEHQTLDINFSYRMRLGVK